MSAFRRKPNMVRLPVMLAVTQPCDPPSPRWWRLIRVKQTAKPLADRQREIPWFLAAEDTQ